MLSTIESVVRFVPDIEAAARWYADLLGAEVRHENPQYAFVVSGGLVIGFHPADEKCPGGIGGTTVYWEVDNLDDAVRRLVSAGARIHRGPGSTSFGARVALLVDPFGCTIGLNQSSEQSRQLIGTGRPSRSPATDPQDVHGAAAARHVQVGVGVLVLQEGLVLLGRRKGSHGAGTWSAPGGALEFGEEILDGAARELREETGLSASSLELGPYTNDVFADDRKHFVTIFVVARGLDGAPANLELEKCEGWAWFRWGEWPTPLFQPARSLLALGWRPRGA